MPAYRDLVAKLRQAFPPPVSDPVHDGYVVFSILRALDQVDALKSQAPILGRPREPDYDAALAQRLGDASRTVESVVAELVGCLEGMLIWGHPRSQVNVVATPSIASIVGVVLPSMYNPNLCSDESGRGFSEVEVRVAALVADLVGYDPRQIGGLFTFGGTGTLLYGLKLGLEKALPDCFRRGMGDRRAVILASDQSHYACQSAAAWLGLGQDQVLKAPTHDDNSVDVLALEQLARAALERGDRIAGIVATMGTTDAFGIDDLGALYLLRERLVEEFKLDYRPHLHADAVIGWAWSVFRECDFADNPWEFRGRTTRALAGIQNRLRHLPLADSLGVDFHKTGFAPYISSLFLVRERNDLECIVRDRHTMPYLYHSGEYHPGLYSLETSRSGSGPMSALASLLLLGREGMQALLGHAVEMSESLRELIVARPELTVLNSDNFGPVTLFRAYPHGVDTFSIQEREVNDPSYRPQLLAHNELNRRIYEQVHREALAGRGVAIGRTDCYRRTSYGEPIVALKSYVLSPFAEESRMHDIVDHVLAARDVVQRENE